jgi:hypothetical protein
MLVATKPEQLSGLSPRQVRKARRFFLDSASSSDLPLTVVSGGHEYCSPAYGVPREAVPYYSVEFIARGAAQSPWATATASSPPAASSHTDPAFPTASRPTPATPLRSTSSDSPARGRPSY